MMDRRPSVASGMVLVEGLLAAAVAVEVMAVVVVVVEARPVW